MTDKFVAGPVRIDDDIRMVAAEVRALRELASDPAKARDGSRIYGFNVKWGTLMSGRLMRVEHYYRAGELSQEQESSYRGLRRELKDAMRQIERLGVTRPTVPLED